MHSCTICAPSPPHVRASTHTHVFGLWFVCNAVSLSTQKTPKNNNIWSLSLSLARCLSPSLAVSVSVCLGMLLRSAHLHPKYSVHLASCGDSKRADTTAPTGSVPASLTRSVSVSISTSASVWAGQSISRWVSKAAVRQLSNFDMILDHLSRSIPQLHTTLLAYTRRVV